MAKLTLDEDIVRKLSRLLDETGLTEIEFAEGDKRIRVARNNSVVAAPVPSQHTPAPPAGDGAARAGDAMPAGTIKSPMVGTVYAAPEPGSPPFVRVGDVVEEGQTLLIIEAMKVMNRLKSPRSGKVTQFFVADGQPVEFDEPLLVIE